jgi:DNA ligase-1
MKVQPNIIINELESDNSRLAKEAVLAKHLEDNNIVFFDGVRMCLDALYTFGVKKVPTKMDDTGQGLSWPVFLELATQLNKRELTGHAARDAIILSMDIATKDQWNDWYRRILIKDLRCGVSEKTINKVCKAGNKPELGVPVFSCQLAHDSANHQKKMQGKKQIEIKLDGIRVITLVHDCYGEKIEMFSRNGKQFHNFDHIIEEFRNVLRQYPLSGPTVFDGEIMSANFQDLMKQVHRKTSTAATDAVLHLFDTIPLTAFLEGKWDMAQHKRSKLTHLWVEEHQTILAHVQALDWEEIDIDTVSGNARYIELNKQAVDGGYEGVMIKDVDAPYVCKRSHTWLKAKPFIEVTLSVVYVEEGTGKNKGLMGALVCEGLDDGKYIQVNVGGGYSDDQRKKYWNYKDNIPGQLVEVRADAVTQNQDGTYSLRFPRFKTFRGVEPGEKL